MRMRLRTNAYERLDACGKWYIPTADEGRNVKDVIKERELLSYELLYGSNEPISLEIGCGQGGFLCKKAKQNPSNSYLGVEKIANVILSGAEKACSENIKNVRFLRANAECLVKYLPETSVKEIFLNFPTPLPNKGYAKQRLTAPRYLEIYKKLLIKNGRIYQKTDDKDFFEFSLEQLQNNGFIILSKSENLHENGEVGIVTEYERKFISLGMPIYALSAKKKD